MKIYKLIYGLLAATLIVFTSCVSNDEPEFDDADAFVAIQQTTAASSEIGVKLEIPVMLTSLSGLQGSVDFTITPDETAGAVEGKHYTIGNSSHTLTFNKENPTQNIVINIIDNDVFEGDVKFTIELTNVQGAKLGANKKCVVTLEDDEHPLAFILGSYTGTGESYFGGGLDWAGRIEKDPTDLNKVWIYNLVPGGSSSNSPVYGIVNEDKTELLIPVEQETAISSSYPHIVLIAFDGETKEELEDNVKCTIAADGTITILDEYGSYVFGDDAMSEGLGWYERVLPGAVLKNSN
jgi:hypothetical protein